MSRILCSKVLFCSSFFLIAFGIFVYPIVNNSIGFYVLSCGALAVVWSFLCYIAKNSIALLINEILSIGISVLLFVLQTLIDMMSNKEISDVLQNLNNMAFLPLLVINGAATVVCLIKKHKIEEKLNGVDPFVTAYEEYLEECKTLK